MTKQEDQLDESMTVARIGTCEALTRKSRLTYQVGTLPDGEVYLRIHRNTGNGFPVSPEEFQKRIQQMVSAKADRSPHPVRRLPRHPRRPR